MDSTQTPRTAILAASLTLFSQKGYFQSSMQDVRQQAGVSIGTIYHYFKNKEEIAFALYQQLMEQMTEAVETRLISQQSFHDACREILAHLFKLGHKSPEAMQFLLYARHRDYLPSLPPVCSAKPFSLMIEAAQEAISRGEVRTMEPVVMVTTIFGPPLRLILLHIEGLLDHNLDHYFESSWACIWRAIKH